MKKILVLGVIAFAAMVSQASYLYWQVSGEDISSITHTSDPNMHVNYATVWAVAENGDKVDVGWSNVSLSGDGEFMHINAADLDSYEGTAYSYYIELANYSTSYDNRTVLAESELWSYDRLVSAGYVQVDHLTSIQQAWTGGAYSVPEPTSALMILLGLSALALRRRV